MSTHQIPEKLGRKLRAIRLHLGYSLDEMAAAVGKEGASRRSRIYEWEQGLREPKSSILLAYARLVDISTDTLIDDSTDLILTPRESR